MAEGEQHKPGGITLEEKQLLPKIAFGENPDFSKEQETYHKEQMHIDSSIPEYRSLKDIVRDKRIGGTNTQALLKNIGNSQYKIQQQKGVHALLSPSEIYVRSPIDTGDFYSRDDMSKLANMYCFVLTEGKHSEYSEELTEESIVHPDAYEALDLIKLMVLNEEVRSIEDVHLHPFHWNEHQKLIFLCEAYEYINADGRSMKSKQKQNTLEKFNMLNREIVSEDWIEMLKLTKEDVKRILSRQQEFKYMTTTTVIYDIGTKHAKYNQNSLFGILRFIRNRYVHYHEDPHAVQQAFGSRPVGFWKFFSLRFPKLFMHIYQNMKKYILYQDEDIEQCLATDYQPKIHPMKILIKTKHSLEKPAVKMLDVGVNTDPQEDASFTGFVSDSDYYTKTTGSPGRKRKYPFSPPSITEEKLRAKRPAIQDEFSESSSIPLNFEEKEEREGAKKVYPVSYKKNEHPTLEDTEEFDDNQIDRSKFIDALDLDQPLLRRQRNTTKIYPTRLVSKTKHSFEKPAVKMLDVGVNTDQPEDVSSSGFVSDYGYYTNTTGSSSEKTKQLQSMIPDNYSDMSEDTCSNSEDEKERIHESKVAICKDKWCSDEMKYSVEPITAGISFHALDLDHRLLRRNKYEYRTLRFYMPITKNTETPSIFESTSLQKNKNEMQRQDVNTDTQSQSQVDEESTATTNLREIQDDATGSSSIPCVISVGGLQTLNIFDCALEEQDLTQIEDRLENEEPSVIKFTNCSGKFSDVDDDVTSKKKYKVEKLTFSFNKSFKELWRLFVFVLNRCYVNSLCLMYNNIDDDDIEKLARVLKDRRITGLDVSYNKNITARGFKNIGIIARENKLFALKAIDCKLEPDKLFELRQGLGDHKLNELDVSRNEELTTAENRKPITKGIETMGKFVANKGVESLKLVGCRLTKKHMKAFQKQLKPTNKGGLLQELDVGYNPTLESASYSILGECLSVCGVSRLHLAGNKIGESHLKSLNTCAKKHQIKFLNVGDNFHLCNGLAELAKTVCDYNLQKLYMNDCTFTVGDLEIFRKCLNRLKAQKLQQISFIDRYRERNTEYLNEVEHYRESVTETVDGVLLPL